MRTCNGETYCFNLLFFILRALRPLRTILEPETQTIIFNSKCYKARNSVIK